MIKCLVEYGSRLSILKPKMAVFISVSTSLAKSFL